MELAYITLPVRLTGGPHREVLVFSSWFQFVDLLQWDQYKHLRVFKTIEDQQTHWFNTSISCHNTQDYHTIIQNTKGPN